MVSIKFKYRPSTVDGNEGSLYFQIIHDRVVRQLATGYKIFDAEWGVSKSMIANGNDAVRNQILTGIREGVRWDKAVRMISCQSLSTYLGLSN
jgi:hypothetical protein